MVLVPLLYLPRVEPTEVGPLVQVATAELSTPSTAPPEGERAEPPARALEAAAAPLPPPTTTPPTTTTLPPATSTTAAPATTVAPTTTHTHAPATTAPPPTAPPTTAPPPTTTTTLALNALGGVLDGREVPKSSYQHRDQGVASWFGAPEATCAHVEIPKGTVVKVTRIGTGVSTTCVINDWGPADRSRIIDLSDDTFARLAPLSVGLIEVIIEW